MRTLLAALILAACHAHAAAAMVTVTSLEGLRSHLDKSGAKVKMAPGTYRLDHADAADFLVFSGDDSHYDFTGVTLEVDTALLERMRDETNMLLITGDHVMLEGLNLVTIGNKHGRNGSRGISIAGDHVTLSQVTLTMQGSYPYGYGSYFGISGRREAAVNPKKMNGIRIGGLHDRVTGCKVIMRCFGHGIFVRGAQEALIEDCTVEGVLRKTDDILAEKSGLAFDLGFKQDNGDPIPAGKMTSLSEDGIRAYPDDPDVNRRTQNIRVENCRVSRMRRGICLAFASGSQVINNCEVTGCERVGYNIGSGTVMRGCRGDARYCEVLGVASSASKKVDVELEVIVSGPRYGNDLLAKINGTGHQVTFKEAAPGTLDSTLEIELGSDRGRGEGRMEDPHAAKVTLQNETPAVVRLRKPTTACVVSSLGDVNDEGMANIIKHKTPARP